MNQLDAAKDAAGGNEEGLDFVLQGIRVNLLENEVTLVVPEGNPKGVEGFDQLAELLKSGDALAASGALTYGSNVKEVTTQVSEGMVDCGIIYATDAFSAALAIVDEASAEMCGQVIYPAAVLNTTSHEAQAKAFLEYLQSDAAMAVFQSVGFSPAG